MKLDIILAGVGGQGILSLAALISRCALERALFFKQSEIHGMSQRGGSVFAHVRVADTPIHSPTIPQGCANLILAMEPLESLRYLPYLAPDGVLVTADTPVKNMADYPDSELLFRTVRQLPNAALVQAEAIASSCGSLKGMNMVLLGAASLHLPFAVEELRNAIRQTFSGKGEQIIDANLAAFEGGRSSSAEFAA